MARWLVGLLLVSGSAFASQGMYSLMSTGDFLSPIEMVKKLEQLHPGVISEFEAELDDGELIYEFKIINPDENTISEYEYRATDGSLKSRDIAPLRHRNQDELAGTLMLQQSGLSFSEMLTIICKDRSGHIVKAEIDSDLGISYIELEILDVDGKTKLAFDMESKQLLPLLKWD
ncbi:hypothetical protein [Shewanella youngdeokensis]|uniref:PepSY domain-containing protein n=1 Tax=Shewanella youngdeokensis TaxID=2999068 RepID=A0ABZ0K0U2_9GAMM|nr:hypothetical protein RGE70_00475 [Shewanella sp. DAU334]